MENHQYFDAKAEDWDIDPRVERARVIAARLAEQIQPSPTTTAVDFGCGTGLLGFALLPSIGHLTLADPSSGMLKVAELKITTEDKDRVTILHLEGEGEILPDSYDLIMSLMTLHHIHETEEVVRSLTQHLNPGGTLALADLDSEDGSFHGPDADVHRGFERSVIRNWMIDSGLRGVSDSTPWTMHKRVDGVDREYPLFLVTGQR